jgi:hypothetical protein
MIHQTKTPRLGTEALVKISRAEVTAQPPESGKPQEKHWEDRANWASCFPPRNPKSEHPPNFTGITVVDGKKYWVNCYEKLDRNGNRYVSVNIRPFSAERA